MRIRIHSLVVAGLLSASGASAFVWPTAIDRTAKDLVASDVAVRRRAARRLFDLPRDSIERLGLPALGDSDPDVRLAALEALLAAGAPGVGDRVVTWLGDADARVRRAAGEALVKEPSLRAVPALGRVLSDPEAEVRSAAARALGASGASEAVVSLLGRLDDPDPEVREAVVLALSRIGDKSAVVPLIGKIQDSRPNVRRSVALALGNLGDARAASALTLVLRDSDEVVRVAALEALAELHSEDAVSTIVSLLAEERRPAVRKAAFDALAAIPVDSALDALVAALAEDEPRERSPARAALVRAGERAARKLAHVLNGQPSFNLADGAALALGEMRANDASELVASALRRGVVRPEAGLKALALSHDPRALGPVLEYLSAKDGWVRKAAVDAADALLDPREPDGRAVEPIERALDAAHSRRTERIALVALLGKTGAARAAPVLAAFALDATDSNLRLAAIRGLGLLGPTGQDATLLDALGDERAPLRLAAALSLRRTGAAKTAVQILDRLESAADQDRGALALALAGPLSVSNDAAVFGRVERRIREIDGAERDALIEDLGGAPGAASSAAFGRVLDEGVDAPSRAKIAEALAGHVEASARLRALLGDPDAVVRANAAWSLGVLQDAASAEALKLAANDPDAMVAGDAVAALGRIAVKDAALAPTLCTALADFRPYVRVNALAGIGASGARCNGGLERRILANDAADVVRAAAARLLSLGGARTDPETRAALARCAEGDPSGEVAASCAQGSSPPPAGVVHVSVYVVPDGATDPAPLSAFALFLSDGFVRLGVADRRGAVYEAAAPRGLLKLGIPAPLLF